MALGTQRAGAAPSLMHSQPHKHRCKPLQVAVALYVHLGRRMLLQLEALLGLLLLPLAEGKGVAVVEQQQAALEVRRGKKSRPSACAVLMLPQPPAPAVVPLLACRKSRVGKGERLHSEAGTVVGSARPHAGPSGLPFSARTARDRAGSVPRWPAEPSKPGQRT